VLLRALAAGVASIFRMCALCWLRVPPEAVALADLVRRSPELAEALRDPRVLALLHDPATQRELAQLLRSAAEAPPAPIPSLFH
jgi:hypothetical protein